MSEPNCHQHHAETRPRCRTRLSEETTMDDDDYQPFWRCPDCGREYDDIDDGPCPADDCPSRDDTGDDNPLEPDEYSDEAADAAEDKWLAARAAPYER